MKIPLNNLYYLLCYAWDRLEEGQVVSTSVSGTTQLADLFARVLLNGVQHACRRGLDCGYVLISDDLTRIRGRVDFATSLRRGLLEQAKAHCRFDELSPNTVANRIIKSTLLRLARLNSLDKRLRADILMLCRGLDAVHEIPIRSSSFRQVQLHGNNRFYGFLLSVCQLVHKCLLPDPSSGQSRFRDFTQNDDEMARVFEAFVLNFYKREQRRFRVGSECIGWDAACISGSPDPPLPMMKTDVSLRSLSQTIIIDAKFYREALQTHLGKTTVRSSHLYQLCSYLKNLEVNGGADAVAAGVLLYPTVTRHIDVSYRILGHEIRMYTLNLAQDWRSIHNELLALVGVPSHLTQDGALPIRRARNA